MPRERQLERVQQYNYTQRAATSIPHTANTYCQAPHCLPRFTTPTFTFSLALVLYQHITNTKKTHKQKTAKTRFHFPEVNASNTVPLTVPLHPQSLSKVRTIALMTQYQGTFKKSGRQRTGRSPCSCRRPFPYHSRTTEVPVFTVYFACGVKKC